MQCLCREALEGACIHKSYLDDNTLGTLLFCNDGGLALLSPSACFVFLPDQPAHSSRKRSRGATVEERCGAFTHNLPSSCRETDVAVECQASASLYLSIVHSSVPIDIAHQACPSWSLGLCRSVPMQYFTALTATTVCPSSYPVLTVETLLFDIEEL